MWYRDRVWIHYVNDIIAADMSSAVFLAGYIRRVDLTKEFVNTLEVFDLQRYKVVKKSLMIRNILREKRNKPFVFIASKN